MTGILLGIGQCDHDGDDGDGPSRPGSVFRETVIDAGRGPEWRLALSFKDGLGGTISVSDRDVAANVWLWSASQDPESPPSPGRDGDPHPGSGTPVRGMGLRGAQMIFHEGPRCFAHRVAAEGTRSGQIFGQIAPPVNSNLN